MKNSIKKFFIIALSVFLCGCNFNAKYINDDKSVIVSLKESDDFTILSDNPVSINKGEDAVFYVKLNSGVKFDDKSIGEFDEENEKYIVRNVQMSQEVELKTYVEGKYTLKVVNTYWSRGTVNVIPTKDYYAFGEEVVIETTEKTDIEFLCYTKSYPYRCVDATMPSGMPISFKNSYRFNITEDLVIYANYYEDPSVKITYDANGGNTFEGDENFTLDYDIPIQFTSPTTILGTHFMEREGYTLESFNTEKDGSGVRIGIGSSVDINLFNERSITLYANWEKWSDKSLFVYE